MNNGGEFLKYVCFWLAVIDKEDYYAGIFWIYGVGEKMSGMGKKRAIVFVYGRRLGFLGQDYDWS